MKEDKIKILKADVNKKPYEAVIANRLADMQLQVHGYIQAFPVNYKVVMICNEEGKLKDLPLNKIACFNNGFAEAIVGDVFFCGVAGEEFCSLTDKQIEVLKHHVSDDFTIDIEDLASDLDVLEV